MNAYLARPNVQAYLDRPLVRPILIFAGLGILTSFIRTLVIDPHGGTALPLLSLWDVLLRLGVAVLWFAGTVIALRPGKHSTLESAVWATASCVFAFFLTWADRPAAALMTIPVVARYWLSMRQAVALLIALLVVTVATYTFIPPVPSFSDPQEWAGLVMLVVVTVSQGAFTYAAFELLVQNEQKQRALNAVNLELRENQAAQMQSAALEERAYISRELHDTLGHELAALRLEVQRARKLETKVAAPSQPVLEALDGAMNRSGLALQQLQSVVSALRTPRLDGTLFQALDDLIDSWPEPVTLTVTAPEPPLTTPVKLAFYRAVQETLTNSYKHAPHQPTQVQINLVDDRLQIIVSNQKAEAQAAPRRSSGTGLASLQRRFQDIGGKVEIHDLEDEFTVWLTLPIAK